MHMSQQKNQSLTPLNRRHYSPGGFTLVEILVVVAIIGLLIGLLVPALGAMRRQSKKTNELNNIRQVGYAWAMYSNSNNDAALPGFLEPEVQNPSVPGQHSGWDVRYYFPDRSVIPNTPVNLPGPWPWRLLPYLDYSNQIVRAYANEDDDILMMASNAEAIAYEPAFGYNGMYIGGHWEIMTIDSRQMPRFRFYDHKGMDDDGEMTHMSLSIPQTVPQIRRTTELVTFCSASKLDAGVHMRFRPDTPGAALVMPPILESSAQWRQYQNVAAEEVEVLVNGAYVPIPRYTNTIAALFPDGHCDTASYATLADQRRWIDNATSRWFKHRAY